MFFRASLSALTLLAALTAFTPDAHADQRRGGSLLLFPIFDNRPGTATLLTVTNSNQISSGNIAVEFVYRNWDVCNEFNRTRILTPGDTITVLTSQDNPNVSHMKGYVYAFAKNPTTGQAIVFDHLIGTTRIFSALTGSFEVEPFVFRSGQRSPQGTPTDTDGDGIRDLNGDEYEQAPEELLIPSFFGQIPGSFRSQLVLINLSGGPQFTAIANFLIYNDNEDVFSAQRQFKCWEMVDLIDVNAAFSKSFLQSTDHNPSEGPAWGNEGGWFTIDGSIAFSTAAQINDPAILAVRIEQLAPNSLCLGAALPFTRGLQANGDLLPVGPFGDTSP